jgi:hypothetical protein
METIASVDGLEHVILKVRAEVQRRGGLHRDDELNKVDGLTGLLRAETASEAPNSRVLRDLVDDLYAIVSGNL